MFQYDPVTSTYTKKFDFGATSGCYPHGALIQAKDGMFYGLAVQGGVNDKGVLFQYDPVHSIYNKKIDFDSIHGSYPLGTLLQVGNGSFYGYTTQGGMNNMGVLFQYNAIPNTCMNKLDFAGENGNSPLGFLIQASDSMLYGMTNTGGATNTGVLFQYDPATSVYTKKFDFDSINGNYPYGSLLQGKDGFIYGMTSLGGVTNYGVLFQYDITNSSYNKKIEFNTVTGELPYSSLIEINLKNTGITEEKRQKLQLSIFPNPNNGEFTLQSNVEGAYTIVDILGQPIESFKLDASNKYTSSIKNLSDGLYTIISNSNHYVCRQKIVVVK